MPHAQISKQTRLAGMNIWREPARAHVDLIQGLATQTDLEKVLTRMGGAYYWGLGIM